MARRIVFALLLILARFTTTEAATTTVYNLTIGSVLIDGCFPCRDSSRVPLTGTMTITELKSNTPDVTDHAISDIHFACLDCPETRRYVITGEGRMTSGAVGIEEVSLSLMINDWPEKVKLRRDTRGGSLQALGLILDGANYSLEVFAFPSVPIVEDYRLAIGDGGGNGTRLQATCLPHSSIPLKGNLLVALLDSGEDFDFYGLTTVDWNDDLADGDYRLQGSGTVLDHRRVGLRAVDFRIVVNDEPVHFLASEDWEPAPFEREGELPIIDIFALEEVSNGFPCRPIYTLHLVARPGHYGPEFRRSDANDDGGFNLSDAVFILNSLFTGGPQASCEDAADADDDGEATLTDAVYMLNHLFLGGSPPPSPGPEECGADPTPDTLTQCKSDC